MEGFDIPGFEREIIKSYEERALTSTAMLLLSKLNSVIGRKVILKFDSQTNKEIRQACLQRMIDRWEGHYTAKKSIFSYFHDICKQGYSSECLKINRENIKQRKTDDAGLSSR